MRFIKRNWKTRTLVILTLSALVSLIFYSLEFTQWAGGINEVLPVVEECIGIDCEGVRPPSSFLMKILPFAKVLMLTLVPASIVVGIRAAYKLTSRVMPSL